MPRLSDPLRAVRIEAARALLDVRGVRYPPEVDAALGRAMADYQGSLYAKADFPEIQMALGGVALVLRNPKAAEQAFSRAVEMDPQLVDAWLMIARLHNARRDAASAEGALEKALRYVPNDARLHHSMANARMLAGKPRKALEALERAAKLSPDDPAVLADLGALLSSQGEHDRAVPVLRKAGALGASSPDLLYALAKSQIAVGQREAAELTILKLQLLYPDSPQTREADKLR